MHTESESHTFSISPNGPWREKQERLGRNGIGPICVSAVLQHVRWASCPQVESAYGRLGEEIKWRLSPNDATCARPLWDPCGLQALHELLVSRSPKLQQGSGNGSMLRYRSQWSSTLSTATRTWCTRARAGGRSTLFPVFQKHTCHFSFPLRAADTLTRKITTTRTQRIHRFFTRNRCSTQTQHPSPFHFAPSIGPLRSDSCVPSTSP